MSNTIQIILKLTTDNWFSVIYRREITIVKQIVLQFRKFGMVIFLDNILTRFQESIGVYITSTAQRFGKPRSLIVRYPSFKLKSNQIFTLPTVFFTIVVALPNNNFIHSFNILQLTVFLRWQSTGQLSFSNINI